MEEKEKEGEEHYKKSESGCGGVCVGEGGMLNM